MATLVDSYSETNQDANFVVSSGGSPSIYPGQAFTGIAIDIDSAKFYLKKTGSPTGNAYAVLYAITGTYGTSARPTGSALATSDAFDVSTLTESYQLITFTFSGAERYTMSATYYAIVVEHDGGDGSNSVESGVDNSSPSHDGNLCYKNFGTWTGSAAYDCCFYVYGDSGVTPSVVQNVQLLQLLGCGT